jgi:hypothetical protein
LYSSPDIIIIIKWRLRGAWHVGHMGEKGSVYRSLAGKSEE